MHHFGPIAHIFVPLMVFLLMTLAPLDFLYYHRTNTVIVFSGQSDCLYINPIVYSSAVKTSVSLVHDSNIKARAMFSCLVTPVLALLITIAVALPTVESSPLAALNETQLISIAPKSSSCANAAYPLECRTAAQAVGPISASFTTYDVTTQEEQAAILSTMAFESGDFQYQVNHFPGIPGQGTRNMQSSAYNLQYAQSISALGPYLEKIQTTDAVAVLNLLILYMNYDFGSAAVRHLSFYHPFQSSNIS